MSRRTSHFRGGVCRGYPTPTQSIAVNHVISRNWSTTRSMDKKIIIIKTVGQVYVLILSGSFGRTRANSMSEQNGVGFSK